jgi:hypothetical protein
MRRLANVFLYSSQRASHSLNELRALIVCASLSLVGDIGIMALLCSERGGSCDGLRG